MFSAFFIHFKSAIFFFQVTIQFFKPINRMKFSTHLKSIGFFYANSKFLMD